MSRIGKKPVSVPAGVKIALDPSKRKIDVSGPKGSLSMVHRPEVKVQWEESEKRVVCTIPEERMSDGQSRAYWGLTRALIASMVKGVNEGYRKQLEVVGVGWTAKLQGRNLVLSVGYANQITMPVPDGVTVEVQGQIVTVSGPDKQAVGEFAAAVRSKRKPEPYNGKGIKYTDEVIQRKQGKAFGS